MNLHRYEKLAPLALVPVLALAYYVAYIPHLTYPYPVHIDEWVHLAFSRAMLEAGSTSFTDPFLGQSAVGAGSPHLEAGFHLFWGVFQRVSGLSWMAIYRYFPGIIFVLTVASVYVLGRRKGFGWEAAFFTALIPTTVGILGPGFLVPLATGLFFTPLALFLAFYLRSPLAWITLFIFMSLLLVMHAPSAVFIALIIGPYALLNLKGDFRRALGLGLALLVPFLLPFPWIFDLLLPTAKSVLVPHPLTPYVDFPRVLREYGYLPATFCLVGTAVLFLKGGRENTALVLGLLGVLLVLVARYTFNYGIHILYARGLMFMMMMVAVVGGAGLATFRKLDAPFLSSFREGKPVLARATGVLLLLAVSAATLAVALPQRLNTPYYHMIDHQEYQDFVWMRDNLGGSYRKAILDPWKATAFTAITGKFAYTRIHMAPTPVDQKAYAFLDSGCEDTGFLRQNGISIIYNRSGCRNPDLVEVKENIYLLKEEGPE